MNEVVIRGSVNKMFDKLSKIIHNCEYFFSTCETFRSHLKERYSLQLLCTKATIFLLDGLQNNKRSRRAKFTIAREKLASQKHTCHKVIEIYIFSKKVKELTLQTFFNSMLD